MHMINGRMRQVGRRQGVPLGFRGVGRIGDTTTVSQVCISQNPDGTCAEYGAAVTSNGGSSVEATPYFSTTTGNSLTINPAGNVVSSNTTYPSWLLSLPGFQVQSSSPSTGISPTTLMYAAMGLFVVVAIMSGGRR